MHLLKNFKKSMDQIKKETVWWTYAAWTLPFTALAVLFFTWFIGTSEFYRTILTTISVIFFTISVLWWWWALYKIKNIYISLVNNEDKLDLLRKEISNLRETLPQNANTR